MSFKTKAGDYVPDEHTWRKHLLATVAQKFSSIFKRPLSHYLSITRGFNLNEFAWKIGAAPESGKNWREVVAQEYGEDALALIILLTGPPRRMTGEQTAQARKLPNSPQAIAQDVPSSSFAGLFSNAENIEAQKAGFNSVADANGFGSLFADEPEAQESESKPSGFASLFGD